MSPEADSQTQDEVLAEVWRIKEELAAKFDFDVHRMAEDARRQQAASGRRILPPRPKPTTTSIDEAAEQVLAKNADLYQRLA